MRRPLATLLTTALIGSGLAVATAGTAQAANAGALLYGLTSANHLVTFREAVPGTAVSDVAVTGLGTGESLLGIDVRPATGQLFGLGSASRLYTINPTTGAATQIGADGAFTLSGTDFGFDVNPVADRLRVVSNTGQNLRLNPITGALAGTDTALAYAGADTNAGTTPVVSATAYTNSVAGPTATTIYYLDTATDTLDTSVGSPNTGQLATVGALGVNATGSSGLEIDAASGKAFAVINSSFYTVNLGSGAATVVGTALAGLVDVAAPPVARPGYVLLTDNSLATFDASTGGTIGTPVAITLGGSPLGSDVVGIDVRPATGALYAVTADSNLFTVAPSGAATLIGALTTALSGTAFGVDFNPVVDRLRIVSDTGQSLAVNPTTAAVVVNVSLNGGTTGAIGAGYTNSFPGAASTTLYDIDAASDTLYVQVPATGVTTAIGTGLGVDITAASDLDITPEGNTAYAALTVGGVPSLYRVDLTAGTGSVVGTFSNALVEDLALGTPGRLDALGTAGPEFGATIDITVTRTGGSAGVVGVDYATADGSAKAGQDYTATSGTLRFADGETSKTITVPVLADTAVEGLESFSVVFSNELGGTPTVDAVVGQIIDDEGDREYVLTADNKLGSTTLASPGTISNLLPITGTGGADVVGIDVRPANGLLYAVTADSKLYTLDTTTAVATLVAPLGTALSGAAFGVDFNPAADRLRIASDTGQNLRINPDTGASATGAGTTDTALNGATTSAIGAAYTNSFSGTASTSLYYADAASDALYLSPSPNGGMTTSVGALGVDVTSAGDFDIHPNGNNAFAAFTPSGGVATLYRVDLTTGAATSLGAFQATDVEDLAFDLTGRLGFSAATATVSEAAGTATITVNRTGSSNGAVGVSYATSDTQLAKAGTDYTATSGTLAFASGETSKTFTVPVTQDTAVEGPETFTVTLSSPTGGAGTGPATTQVVTISDDDTTTAYGLTTDNRVVTFNPTNPTAAPTANVAVAGLGAGEDLLGLDYRPADNRVYTISSLGKIYALDPTTGATSYISTSSTLPSGTAFGVDVNPVADRLRVVSNTGQNLRINIATGAATVDGTLAYDPADAGNGSTPAVSAVGYTNSATGQSSTALFDVDTARDVLVLQNANPGTLTTVGALGVDVTTVAGLDLAFPGNSAFAVLTPTAGAAGLYRIDTATGAASLLGLLATATVEDLTLVSGALAALPTPTPTATPTPSPTATGQAGGYHALPPTRLLDTRRMPPSLVGGTDRTVVVAGQGGVPATGVSAVVLNVTVTGSSTRGNLQLFPAGAKPAQRTSNLNFAKGQSIAVQVQVGLGTGGAVGVFLNTGTADLVVDVLGWYGDGSDTSGLGYQALSPTRLLDTRTTSAGKVKAGSPRQQQVTGLAGVPAGASAVALNVTVTDASNTLNVGLFPGGTPPKARTSTLNVTKGQTLANAAVVTLASDGSLGVSVSTGSASVVLDVVGYYGAGATSRFTPVTPVRLLDTRTTAGGGVIKPSADRAVKVTGASGVPGNATAAVLSVTGTQTLNHPWLQVYPTGVNADRTSTLNLLQGADIANLAVTKLGTGGQASLRISQFFTHAVVDVTGYFS